MLNLSNRTLEPDIRRLNPLTKTALHSFFRKRILFIPAPAKYSNFYFRSCEYSYILAYDISVLLTLIGHDRIR